MARRLTYTKPRDTDLNGPLPLAFGCIHDPNTERGYINAWFFLFFGDHDWIRIFTPKTMAPFDVELHSPIGAE